VLPETEFFFTLLLHCLICWPFSQSGDIYPLCSVCSPRVQCPYIVLSDSSSSHIVTLSALYETLAKFSQIADNKLVKYGP
jgi:hypothetical protein